MLGRGWAAHLHQDSSAAAVLRLLLAAAGTSPGPRWPPECPRKLWGKQISPLCRAGVQGTAPSSLVLQESSRALKQRPGALLLPFWVSPSTGGGCALLTFPFPKPSSCAAELQHGHSLGELALPVPPSITQPSGRHAAWPQSGCQPTDREVLGGRRQPAPLLVEMRALEHFSPPFPSSPEPQLLLSSSSLSPAWLSQPRLRWEQPQGRFGAPQH